MYKYGIKASYSMSEIVHASRLKRRESKLVENLTYCSGNQQDFGDFRIEMLLKRDAPGIEL